MLDTQTLGLRRIGFYVACQLHIERFKRLPNSTQDLQKVTASVMSEARFQKYLGWYKRICKS